MAHGRWKEKRGKCKWDVQAQPVQYKIWKGERELRARESLLALAQPLGTGLLKGMHSHKLTVV